MVYFMQPTGGGPVKIGFTDNLPARHKQLERRYGRPLAVLATLEGDLDTEREVHARFAHLRLDGPSGRHVEQFRPAPDLMAFIGRPLLVSPNPESVETLLPAGFDPSQGPPIRIEADIVSMLKYMAEREGVTVTKLASDLLRTPLEREFHAVGQRLSKKLAERGEP